MFYDNRAPGGSDPARHIATAGAIGDEIERGDLLAPFTFEGSWDFFYPPLVRTIGAIPELLGLNVGDWGSVLLNLIFVPLLVAGCYLVGRRVYGPRAGVPAAIFALGTPMVLQLFHVFLLDTPLTAMVAITLAALLASERFERRKESVIAGALLGIALLVKTPAPLFLLGPIAVMLIGGGWRRWRNVALFALAVIVIAGPFYVVRADDFLDLSEQATVTGSTLPFKAPVEESDATVSVFGPSLDTQGLDRVSPQRMTWYLWVAVNLQYLVPLLLLFAIGLVYAIREARRRPGIPELLAGLVVGYVSISLLTLHDARYTLPLVVFIAVIGTGWIAVAGRDWVRGAGVGLLAGAVVLNVAAVTIGGLGTVKLALPDANEYDVARPGVLTFMDERGYVTAEPRPDDFWQRLLAAAESEGIDTIRFDEGRTTVWGTDSFGFEVLAKEYGISGPWNFTAEFPDPEARPEVRVTVWNDDSFLERPPRPVPEPCHVIEEGTEVPGTDPAQVRVAVERFEDGEWRRWCDF